MSNVYELPQQERRHDEASLWIARLDRQLSAEEATALQSWMAEDPQNEAVLMEMAHLWDKMDALSRLSALFPLPVEERSSRAPFFAVASFASVLIATVALWFAWPYLTTPAHNMPTELVYQTSVGERANVTLMDGSTLVLNTNSRVLVKFTPDQRLLTLERGEVHVKVAKDETRPLSVVAGDRVVQAVGTEFNVEITSDQQIELVVLEGKVKVGVRQRPEKSPKAEKPEVIEREGKTLVAGEALILSSPQEEVTKVSTEDIEVKLSWRQGNLVFRGESLEDAVREVERYTSVEFVFLDEDLKKIRVAGLFRAGDVQGLLATLRENFNIVYQFTDEQKVELSTQ